jgi:hypothetical protein
MIILDYLKKLAPNNISSKQKAAPMERLFYE